MRNMQIQELSAATWESGKLEQESIEALKAYSDGVNDFVQGVSLSAAEQEQTARLLPPEFLVFGITQESFKKWFNLEKLWVIADSEKITNELDCINSIKKAILDSVKKHLVADVPIGIFLSGGVDSALLAFLISKNFKKNITAITILFEEPESSYL